MIPISVTPEAAAEIRRTMATKNVPEGWHLRVGIRGGGCGATPIIGFDVRKEGDMLFECEGISVIMDKKHLMFLFGKQVGFYEGSDKRGFHISNPATPEN